MAETILSAADPDPIPESTPGEQRAIQIAVEAIYEDGVIKPLTPLDLPPGTPIVLHVATHVTAVVVPQAAAAEVAPAGQPAPARRLGWSSLRLPHMADMMEAWNAESFRTLRQRLRAGPLFGACERCPETW